MRKHHPISVDELAAMVARGFETTSTKEDVAELRRDMDLGFRSVSDTMKAIVDTLDLMRADMRDIKITLGGLVRSFTVLEEQVQHLDKRVSRLEAKSRSR